MPAFRYQATDLQGQTTSGDVEAASLDEARGRLLERGLRVLELSPIAAEPTPSILSGAEADELVQHVSRLAEAGFPLGAGFRAAAGESDSESVARALRLLAERIDRGQPLSDVLQGSGGWLPSHIAGLIAAALRTGRLSEALIELVEQQRGTRALRQRVRQAMAYPLTVAVIATGLLALITFLLTGAFERMFHEFQIVLPLATRHLLWWRETGIWVLGGVVAVGLLAALVYRRYRGPAAWAQLTAAFPLFGPLFFLRAMAEWAGLMSVLIKNHVPLPDALRWSADGVNNAWVAHTSRLWANEAAHGQSISNLLSRPRGFPNTLAPLIRWGEKNGSLAEAFAAGREIMERRVQLRAELLRTILPPLLFVVIGCCAMLLLVALFMPMIALLNGLGGNGVIYSISR
jgi:type IV pilus assembly protein PilC